MKKCGILSAAWMSPRLRYPDHRGPGDTAGHSPIPASHSFEFMPKTNSFRFQALFPTLAFCLLCTCLTGCGETAAPNAVETADSTTADSDAADSDTAVADVAKEATPAPDGVQTGKVTASSSTSTDVAEEKASESPIAATESNTKTPDTKTAPAPKPSLYSPEAFRKAALDGKLRVIEVCLKDNLDVNEKDNNGFTALAMAAYNGHTKVVKLLLKNGAEVDIRDSKGMTPLIHACSGPFAETATTLLDAGADINAVDNGEGFTPLMMAAAEGNVEVVKVLLKAGADKSMVDIDNEDAKHFARQKGHFEIVKLLE